MIIFAMDTSAAAASCALLGGRPTDCSILYRCPPDPQPDHHADGGIAAVVQPHDHPAGGFVCRFGGSRLLHRSAHRGSCRQRDGAGAGQALRCRFRTGRTGVQPVRPHRHHLSCTGCALRSGLHRLVRRRPADAADARGLCADGRPAVRTADSSFPTGYPSRWWATERSW